MHITWGLQLRLRSLVVGALVLPRPQWVDPRLVRYRSGLQVSPRRVGLGHAYSPTALLARLNQLCLAVSALHARGVHVVFWGGYGFSTLTRALVWARPPLARGQVVLTIGAHLPRNYRARGGQVWLALAPTADAVPYAGVPVRAAALVLLGGLGRSELEWVRLWWDWTYF